VVYYKLYKLIIDGTKGVGCSTISTDTAIKSNAVSSIACQAYLA
jgi:hypothetical protein